MAPGLSASLLQTARDHGAVAAGVTDARPFHDAIARVTHDKATGLSGPLHFTFDDPDTAGDVTRSFPWARSIVVVGSDYLDDASHPSPRGAVIARFATADHYAGVKRAAVAVARSLRDLGHRAEVLFDDNRLLDRAAAARAGVGWIGKSSMVLTPGHGPWILLGSVVTDADLETTAPMLRTCGTCTACIPACPTGAIGGEGGIDARRCLSTWLQTAGSIPQWIRPLLGRRIYGCDDCLDACPPGMPRLAEVPGSTETFSFRLLLEMSDDDLMARFPWWYVPHRAGRYLRRNSLVAAGNSGEPDAVPAVRDHFHHPSSMIRSHAAWAMARLEGGQAVDLLASALEGETAPETKDELYLALLMIQQPQLHQQMLLLDEWAGTNQSVRGLGLWPDSRLDKFLVVTAGDAGAAPQAAAANITISNPANLPTLVAGASVPPVRVYDPDRELEALRRSWRNEVRAND